MKVQSTFTPSIVPATFQDWKKKHLFNPENEPISYSHFRKRGKAPKLHLKHYNYDFKPKEVKENVVIRFVNDVQEIPSNIILEFKRHITPLFAWV